MIAAAPIASASISGEANSTEVITMAMSNFRNLLEQRVAAVASAGLGALTLGVATPGHIGFVTADNGLPFRIKITEGDNGAAWEICEATYTHAGASLSRGAIEASSAAGARVAFTAAAVVQQVVTAAQLAAIEEAANQTPEIPELPDDLVTLGTGGALMCDDDIVAPAYLGIRTEAQITATHAAIAAGTASYPGGSVLITEAGEPWTLKGLGPAARFSPETSSAPEVTVQPIRTGASNAVQADAGSIIPFSFSGTYTVGTGLADFSAMVERADNASARVLSGAGVTLWHNGAIVTELEITGIGHYIVIRPRAGFVDHYLLSRYTGA